VVVPSVLGHTQRQANITVQVAAECQDGQAEYLAN
jgi:hypothetical protein